MRFAMRSRVTLAAILIATAALPWTGGTAAQAPPPGMQPGMQGGPGGPGGFGPNQPERQIVAQFDKDKDKRLNAIERREARLWLESQPAGGQGRGGRGPGGPGRGGMMTPGSPGPALKPADVKKYGTEPLYDPAVLRTLFFQFEN